MAKKITDITIKGWLSGRFENKACGNGLYLVYRKSMAVPMWRYRYRLAGKQRQMFIGSYKDLTLADANREAKRLNALVALGHDVSLEKQDRKREGLARREADKNRITVAALADRFYQERIAGKKARDKDIWGYLKRIESYIGKLNVEDVTGKDINAMYQKDLARGFPVSTNKLRQLTLQLFGYAVALHLIEHNPAQWLNVSYAGGKQEARERNLSREELVRLFAEMRKLKFVRENYLAVKLLLLLCVRKTELTQAKKSEFDLDAGIWTLNKGRTKTRLAIDIPLPAQAVDALRELFALSGLSEYLLPSRAPRHRRLPHISDATLNAALAAIKSVDDLTVHDFRRTAKTMLQLNGVDEFISERCLNHKIPGMAGTYGRHDFFTERKAALQLWANYLEACEVGNSWNVVPIQKPQPTMRKS